MKENGQKSGEKTTRGEGEETEQRLLLAINTLREKAEPVREAHLRYLDT